VALACGRAPFSGHAQTRQDHTSLRRVEALMGAALLVRRSAFEEAGGFDESFFLYAEETDLMARWRDRGWGILYVPEAEVTHAGGRSGGDRLFGQLHASLVRYTRKHHGNAAAMLASRAWRRRSTGTPPWSRREYGRARRARYCAALSRTACDEALIYSILPRPRTRPGRPRDRNHHLLEALARAFRVRAFALLDPERCTRAARFRRASRSSGCRISRAASRRLRRELLTGRSTAAAVRSARLERRLEPRARAAALWIVAHSYHGPAALAAGARCRWTFTT
jgi:hypothetical protein